ncbi:hypothetical protein ScPMuIL_008542 [Solemya velum]
MALGSTAWVDQSQVRPHRKESEADQRTRTSPRDLPQHTSISSLIARERAQKAGRSISKIAEFTKECSAEWKDMDAATKKQFDEKAAKDKQRYDREMCEYKGVSAPDPNKPKRPQSSYFLFLADFRERMKNGGLDHKQILSKAGEEWRELTDKAKEPYIKKSLEEKKKYDVAMAQYGQNCKATAAKKAKQDLNGGAAQEEEEEDDDDEEEDDDEEDDDDDEEDDE